MLDWSTKDSITKVAFLLAFIKKNSTRLILEDTRSNARSHLQPICFLSHWEVAFLGQFAMATLVCLPLKSADHALPGWLGWTNLAEMKNPSLILDTLSENVIMCLIIQWIAACICFFKTTFPS